MTTLYDVAKDLADLENNIIVISKKVLDAFEDCRHEIKNDKLQEAMSELRKAFHDQAGR